MSLMMNKEDPRVRRTRKLLIESFGKLLTVKNYESISVTDITKVAEVNRATFYAHFTDKDDLFQEVVLESVQEVLGPTLGSDDELNEESIRKIISSLYEYLEEMEERCSHYNDATKLLVEHRIKLILSDFMFHKLKRNCKTNVAESILRVNAAMIGNAICGAACMGHCGGIDLVTDEICYMVVPIINYLTKR